MLKLAAAPRLAVLCLVALIGIATMSRDSASASTITSRSCAVAPAPIISVSDPIATVTPITASVKPTPPIRSVSPHFALLSPQRDQSTMLEVSGYTSDESQTDGDPCIGSHGINICAKKARNESLCASNVFRIGTRVHVDGLGTCTVIDHMASRYQRNIDWYFGQDSKGSTTKYNRAMKIGRRDRKVTVISRP